VSAVLDFDGLRQRLEAAARPPAFAEIRVRRATRTRRRVVAAAAVATALVLAVSIGTTAALRGLGAPVEPAQTSTPPPAPTSPGPTLSIEASAPPPYVMALVPSPSGRLFAIIDHCVTGCQGNDSQHEVGLYVTSDLGAGWEKIGPAPNSDSTQLFVADDTHLWVVTDAVVNGSSDGGHTWQQWPLGLGDATDLHGAVAAGVAWFSKGLDVWRATAGGKPTRAGAISADGLAIWQLTPLDGRRAYALVERPDGAPAIWRKTTDGGAHWADVPDPCTGTRYPGSPFSTLAAAPDGSLWVVCAVEPGAGSMLKDLVVSTDSGKTWVKRGELEASGYGNKVFPFSATTAWRTGGRADVLRTTDGTHWTDLTNLESEGAQAFAALDATSAVYVSELEDGPPVFATHDGGATWTRYELPS
jgi:photosystem II stability/assembly factor-like uncharacterized protein